ncbi:MAG: hypothetical protein DMG93_01990 [Acidobacteria bacterium]|nr:MAG: hypothetical protein DMG93_01990 [Acidobacteriota bacterium]
MCHRDPKEGDINISEGKRMARPLSASSNPIGGFFVNRVIAEEIIRKTLTPRNIQARINKAFEFYRKWRKEGTRRASQPFPFQLPLQRTHLALHPRQ